MELRLEGEGGAARRLPRRRVRRTVGEAVQGRRLGGRNGKVSAATPMQSAALPVTPASQFSMVDQNQAPFVDDAVHHAVLYADIFDYPLTRDEIFTFTCAPGASRIEIAWAIDRLLACGKLETEGTFVYCHDRATLVPLRLARQYYARRAWRRARFYAHILWALPYVRMVAVTGALAVDNVDFRDDIDYLIVTAPGRLWMARGLVIGVTKLVRLIGDTLCPNYLISSRALHMDRQDLYVAHELVQMVPIHGKGMTDRLWAENTWCRDLLPNADWKRLEHSSDRLPTSVRLLKALAEKLLWLPPGERVERWEQQRKMAKLSREVPPDVVEVLYTADVCKGHDHGHGARILQLWMSRTSARQDSRTEASASRSEYEPLKTGEAGQPFR